MTNEEAIAVLEEQRNFNRSFQHCFESQVDDISAEMPDDGNEWHVAGEMGALYERNNE